MKRVLFFGAPLVLLATAAAPRAPVPDPFEQRLIAMERQSWVAWQHHDVAFWEHFLSDDHLEIQLGGGWTGKRQVIAGIPRRLHRGFLGDRSIHLPPPRPGYGDAALPGRAGHALRQFRRTQPFSGDRFTSAHGRWENALYVHTPIARPHPH